MAPVPTVVSLLDLNPRKFGSLEEFTLFLSRCLQQRGTRSVLVFSGPLDPLVAAKFQGSGSVFEILDWRWGARFYREIVRLVRKYRPEIVHLHFYEQFSFIPLLLKICGVKRIIYTDHCRQPATLGALKRSVLRLWNAIVPPLTGTRFVAVSAHIKRVLTDCFYMDPPRIEVVLNGVNVDRFRPSTGAQRSILRAAFCIPEGFKAVCAVAELVPEKGISYLLQAAKSILQSHPNTVFLVAGDGRLSNQLRQEAQDLGIANSVRFLGLLSDVSDLLTMADVMVVPSVWQEPAGLVVIEAMASGCPVVATRVGGIPEYIEDGASGMLVDPRSSSQIADAVKRVLDSPERAEDIGRAARQAAVASFGTDRWVAETLDIYKLTLQPVGAVAAVASK